MIKRLFIGSTDIDFLKVGKLFYRIFIIEALIFIAVFIFSLTGILNVNLSVDFTGGTTYQFEANYKDTDIDQVMASNILDVSRYQTFENSNSLIFRATENTQDKETEFLFYLSNKFALIAAIKSFLINILILPLYLLLPFANIIIFIVVNGLLIGREFCGNFLIQFFEKEKIKIINLHLDNKIYVLGVFVVILYTIPFVNLLAPTIANLLFSHLILQSNKSIFK